MRTTETLNQAIDAHLLEKGGELAELVGNPSRTSTYKALRGVGVEIVQMVEMLLDQHWAEVRAFIATNRPGTAAWYVAKALAFQLGDPLTATPSDLYYLFDDATKRIVSFALLRLEGATGYDLTLYVAKKDGAGGAVPLSSTELAAFKEYMAEVKIAGTRLDVQSVAASPLTFTLEIRHEGLVYGEGGVSLSNPSVKPLQAAIRGYLSSLPEGKLVVSQFVEFLLDQADVTDARLSNLATGATAITSEWVVPGGFVSVTDTVLNAITYVRV